MKKKRVQVVLILSSVAFYLLLSLAFVYWWRLKKKHDTKCKRLILIALFMFSVINASNLAINSLILTFILKSFYKYFMRKNCTLLTYEHAESKGDPDFPFFHLSTIIAIMDNFSPANKLGQGGFGFVHKVVPI